MYMDFALFIEKYVFRVLWYLLIGLVIMIPVAIWYELKSGKFFSTSDALYIVGLLIVISVIAVPFGKFMRHLKRQIFTWHNYMRKP